MSRLFRRCCWCMDPPSSCKNDYSNHYLKEKNNYKDNRIKRTQASCTIMEPICILIIPFVLTSGSSGHLKVADRIFCSFAVRNLRRWSKLKQFCCTLFKGGRNTGLWWCCYVKQHSSTCSSGLMTLEYQFILFKVPYCNAAFKPRTIYKRQIGGDDTVYAQTLHQCDIFCWAISANEPRYWSLFSLIQTKMYFCFPSGLCSFCTTGKRFPPLWD